MPVIRHRHPFFSVVEEWCGKDHNGLGSSLALSLSCAVPLWMFHYQRAGPQVRESDLKELQDSDFALRMQYVLVKGPKEGDTARAFNDLAKAIALMSFCPGGVCAFGQRYQWKDSLGKAV